jgi:hypothetical protein
MRLQGKVRQTALFFAAFRFQPGMQGISFGCSDLKREDISMGQVEAHGFMIA